MIGWMFLFHSLVRVCVSFFHRNERGRESGLPMSVCVWIGSVFSCVTVGTNKNHTPMALRVCVCVCAFEFSRSSSLPLLSLGVR